MGCDIHLYVEKRVTTGNWVPVDKWVPDKNSEEKDALTVPYGNHYYSGRNYNLFAILADVRNGRGFAGFDTGDGFNPISVPRGLPSDVSTEIHLEFDRWGDDAHSVSYHTLKDLLEYNWTQVTKLRAEIGATDYFRWIQWKREDGESPDSYASTIGGRTIVKLPTSEMERQIRDLEKQYPEVKTSREMEKIVEEKMGRCVTKIEWEQPYYKTCKRFWSGIIPRLLRLGRPEDVRIVFFFDN